MKLNYFFLILLISFSSCINSYNTEPVKQCNENPRYFSYKGKPTILMGSTEHYGAVLNLDFDYMSYLDELQKCNLNLTRTFTGIYVEPQGAFNIEKNTLAPDPGRFICPFARSEEPGYANGGNKFDLSKWDQHYFKRLKNFISEADKRDIIVEITLFSSIYEEEQWKLNPQNPANNINNLPIVPFKEVQSLLHPEYLAFQENMVKKIVNELNEFNNIYFEICNEPYSDNIPKDWQNHMAELVRQTEKQLPKKHIISYNIGNQSMHIPSLNPSYSAVNFHYAEPEASLENSHLNVPIGDNETGFKGVADWPYRVEAWSFILAGGALFNHLDYSFAVGHETGDFQYPVSQPGGGNNGLRKQFGFLRRFIENLDFIQMRPDTVLINNLSDSSISTQVFSNDNKLYLVYLYKRWKNAKENISVRGLTNFIPPTTGEYLFKSYSDDGIRLYVNNELIINNWTGHSLVIDSGLVKLKKGVKVPLTMEYYNGLYGGSLKITWTAKGYTETILSSDNTIIPEAKHKGIKIAYFKGEDFNSQVHADTLHRINFSVDDFTIFDGEYKNLQTGLLLNLPKGKYKLSWLNPKDGEAINSKEIEHFGGEINLQSPVFDNDLLLQLEKVN
ncbi:MAG: PA14 domain-containing protein [Bacteroidales bacterium]|nr:PA14 domain-containing protein [Bacteroidales bacterium]